MRRSLETLETLVALIRSSQGARIGLKAAVHAEIWNIAQQALSGPDRARFEKLIELTADVGVVPPPLLSSVSPDLGDTAGDILITLTGAFLATTTGVTVGGTAATSVVVINSTTVRARTPAKPAGVYDVVVTTFGGQATLTAAFESWNPVQLSGGPDIYDSDLGVTSGGAPTTISAWVDQGAAPYNLSQPTLALQPLYEIGQFGGGRRHAVSGDGTTNATSRFIENQVAAKLQATGRSMFCVIKTVDTRTSFITQNPSMVVVGQSDNNEWVEGIGLANGSLQIVSFNGATFDRLTEVAAVNDGQPHVIGLTNDSATGNVVFYVDGVAIGTLNTPYSAFYGFRTLLDGFTAPSNQCFFGKLGSAVVTGDVMSTSNIEKITEWMFGRFVQEELAFALVSNANPWPVRDGAPMLPLGNDLFIVGGWDPPNLAWAPTGTTNEVWKSSDGGLTWTQILARDPNPPTSGPGARFRPRHIFPGLVHNVDGVDYIYVIGGDQTDPMFPNFPSDVWRSKDGLIWEQVAASSAWGSIGPGGLPITGRMQHMCWSFNGKIYLAGGQSDLGNAGSAFNDYWVSNDHGATWIQLGTAPWAGRGAVTGNTVMNGFMWMVAGGAFDTVPANTITYREVWKFDGVTWTLVTNTPPWLGRIYNFVQVAPDGTNTPTMYLIGGANGLGTNFAEIWASHDGITWIQRSIVPWQASHADGICFFNGKILQGPGNGGIILADAQVWSAEVILEPWP